MRLIAYVLISSLILGAIILAVIFIGVQTNNIEIPIIFNKKINEKQDFSSDNILDPKKTDNVEKNKGKATSESSKSSSEESGGGGGSSQIPGNSEITGNIINEEYAYLGTPVYCSEESRNIESCEDASQHPICGWFDVASNKCTNSLCVQSFPNECTACKEPSIIYWIDGDCPLHT